MRNVAIVALTLAVAGCSAIVDPDNTRLGGTSPVPDAGLPDGTVPDAAADAPVVDAPVADMTLDCGVPEGCDSPDTRVTCVDGTLEREECARGCNMSTGRCNEGDDTFLPSNVSADFFRAEAPSIVIGTSATYDTGECDASTSNAFVVAMDGGGEACVLSLADFRVGNGVTLRIVGSRALIVVATGEIRIDGTIELSADGRRPGPGGFFGGFGADLEGGGPGGGEPGNHAGMFDDGGGGGGGSCGVGGDGGESAGPGSAADGGEGGVAWAASGSDLQPLVGGSGGGRGRGQPLDGDRSNAGFGGAGGGGLQLTAGVSVRVEGLIRAAGGGGGGGRRDGGGGVNWGSGGGAGSGGSVLIEAPEVSGDGQVVVSGGGGGGYAAATNGETGAVGVDDGRAAGGRPGGGSGAGGDALAGGVGGPGDSVARNGGGGGGGSGCVVVRADSNSALWSLNPGALGVREFPLQR